MKRIFPIIFLMILSIFAVWSLFTPGYFPMHDDTQVSRVIEMGRALREGQFPVRWVPDLGYGYGYPIFNFYGPLPYYVGGALHAIGVPALIATKAMFGIGILAPAFVLFWVMSVSVGWEAGLLSSVLFLYAPYHAVQIYVRGAVGEYWELMFWPLIYYAFVYWGRIKKRNANIALGAIGISGAILAHTLLGYVTVLFVAAGYVCYWLYRLCVRRFDAQMAMWQGITILMGLGISSFFWLPASFEMSLTSVSGQVSATANYLDHFVCVSQLWSSLWGYGGSAIGCVDGQSYMLGKIHLIIAAISILLWAYVRPKEERGVYISGFVLAFVGIFFATSYSSAFWKSIPGFSYIQYPWRFLAVAAFGLSLLGGALPLVMSKKSGYRTGIIVVISLVIVLLSKKWFVPQYTYEIPSSAFEDRIDLRWRASKVSDEYLPVSVVRPKEASGVIFDTIGSGNAVYVVVLEKTVVHEKFRVTATESAVISLHKAYFPGWLYFVNQKEVKPAIVNGLPRITIGSGISEISLIFTDTPVRALGNWISLISVSLLGVMYYGRKNKTKR